MDFNKSQLEKYADVLIWGLESARRGGRVKPYDAVMLRYDPPALPLAEVLYPKLVRRRFNVIMRPGPTPEMEKAFFGLGDDRQLSFVAPGERELVSGLNGGIVLYSPASLTHLKDIDPKKFGKSALARKFMREIMERRENQGKYSWTLGLYPTPELIRQAKLTPAQYFRQVAKACFLDSRDPVRKWKEILKASNHIKRWLTGLRIDTFHMESKHIDLKIRVGEKRRFLGVSGHNIPSFEVFTSPDWRGTEGVYYSDLPSFFRGNYVKGVRLKFRKGSVVKVDAVQGAEFVRKMLGTDPGAARLGEFSLTDRRFSKIDRFMANTLFDENFGGRNGNSHVAVGASYTDTYSGNAAKLTKAAKKRLGFNDSSIHWDLVNTEDKRVTAKLKGGRTVTIYEKGQFKC